MTQLTEAVSNFDRTIALHENPERPGEFAVELDAGWSSLVGIHGGYMAALTVRGAEAVAGTDRVARTTTTSFLRTGQPGPATLFTHLVRSGRALTTVTVDLVQDERILLTSRVTLLTDRAGVEWAERAPLDLLPLEQCVRIETEVGHFDMADGLLDSRSVPFSDGAHAKVKGYVRPLEPRPIDSAWLTMASDWFPPPAFVRLAPPTGGVSIDLTTHVHRPGLVLQHDEWLTAEFSIENSTGGLATERGRIAQLDGTIVAESFQTRLTAQG